MKKFYTKEMLVSEFYRYKNLHGRYPFKMDMESDSTFPSAGAYFTKWGSWTNFLNSLDIIDENGWYHEDVEIIRNNYESVTNLCELNSKLNIKRSIEQVNSLAKQLGYDVKNFINTRDYSQINQKYEKCIIGLCDLYYDLGKCPTVNEYDEYARVNGLVSRRNFTSGINKKFSVLCLELFDNSNKNSKSKEILLKELVDLRNKLNRTPMANELKRHGLSEKKSYYRTFGITYQQLIENLGWGLSTPKLNKRTNEELLSDFYELYKKLGRVPNNFDLQDHSEYCSYQTYNIRFGSIANVLTLLDIPVYANQDMSMGYVSLNKKGEVCRSTQEVIISELLIDSEIDYISEFGYKKIDSRFQHKWVADWYLPKEKIIIEYFGLYVKDYKGKGFIPKYNAVVEKKIASCKKLGIRLIPLFKEDLQNHDYIIRKINKELLKEVI